MYAAGVIVFVSEKMLHIRYKKKKTQRFAWHKIKGDYSRFSNELANTHVRLVLLDSCVRVQVKTKDGYMSLKEYLQAIDEKLEI